MSEQNAFFRWVYRLFAIGGLILLLVIAYFWIQSSLSSKRWRERNTVEVAQPGAGGQAKKERLRFDELKVIRGTGVKLLEVEAETGDSEGGKGFSSGSYGPDYRTRNLIFLEPGKGNARWLFATNNQSIHGTEMLSTGTDDHPGPVLAIYLEVTKGLQEDPDVERKVVPALVRPDGSGYTELGGPVSRTLDQDISEDGRTLGLLLEDRGKLLYREYSLDTFAQTAEKLITLLGQQ